MDTQPPTCQNHVLGNLGELLVGIEPRISRWVYNSSQASNRQYTYNGKVKQIDCLNYRGVESYWNYIGHRG